MIFVEADPRFKIGDLVTDERSDLPDKYLECLYLVVNVGSNIINNRKFYYYELMACYENSKSQTFKCDADSQMGDNLRLVSPSSNKEIPK